MRLFFPVVILTTVFSFACGSSPEYSDVKTDNHNGGYRTLPPADNGGQGETPAQETHDQSAPTVAPAPDQPPPISTPAPSENRVPAFIDSKTGQINDLPTYPSALRTNAQVGLINDAMTAMFVLETGDQVEEIARFYDQVVKSKGWKVVTRILEPDNYNLELQKGELHEGLIRARRDPDTGKTTITVHRAEKAPTQK